jgi:hypothetical protein
MKAFSKKIFQKVLTNFFYYDIIQLERKEVINLATERKPAELSKEALAILEDIKVNGSGTLSEISERSNLKVNASQLGALVARGLVNAVLTDKEVLVKQKRTVNIYSLVETAE